MRWMISLFFCVILFDSISCSDLNGSVDSADSFEFNNMLLLIIQIIFESPNRERGREEDDKDAV